MRKFCFMLPALAILLATVLLTSELGSSLAAQTPGQPVASSHDGVSSSGESNDITAATWVETGAKTVDTRKPRLPVRAKAARRK